MATEFSRGLSALRQERGVSQRTASKDLGISQALLSHYENGIREPGLPFVVRACDYYNVSADFLLGRTLARDGSMLSAEDLMGAEDMDSVLRGSILATLQSKLITGSVSVLFDLLGKLGDKNAINHAANFLSVSVYQLYRQLYRHSGHRDALFATQNRDFDNAIIITDMQLEHLRFVRNLDDGDGSALDMSPQAMTEAYPGRTQSLTQVISTVDKRLSRLAQEDV
ncbi:helix-turn-helix transcriptional regulator [Bengtsoniella intestinalis]|uniref:helix-turn-helix domain-containing protein n=1 Tax=Bengtsoniella intestinalis TaxID=3073143 RepID=UPI00391F58A3